MADIESNVRVNIDTTDALSQLKLLQQQISAFQQAMRKAGADNALAARQMQQNLTNSINATGKFQANIQTIQTSAERFTTALEKNKLSMGEYFRYAGGASKTFGKLFKTEFETINQVARERVKDLQTQYIKLGRDANGAMKAISVRPLALDMDNLGTKTQIAAQRQQLFNQLMKQGSTQLLNFGKNTQWAGRQLMVGFTVPLTLMGSAASKAYMEMEKASIAFQRVYGDMNTTTEETNKMVKSVQSLANEFTKYGVAVADTMDMAAKAAAMGKTGADLLAQVQQANKLAVLGNVDQNQALETTISLTNAFGSSAEELSGKIDFLNAVENQTVTSIEDLTIAIPKAAPVIKQLGGNVEDLTFFLTAMKEGGINASEGANALKSGIASMINPTKKASDFLMGFGVNIKKIVEGNSGDIKQTVIDVAKAFDTLDPLNRARAIEQMFGKFQFSRISTLFQNVIKEGSQAQTVAGLARSTTEELAVLSERELKKVSDSPMFKFQKSIEDMKAKLAPVGEAFLKAVTPIVEFVTKILDGFNNLSTGSKKFITILVTAVAGIGPLLLMTFGLLANGIANIMKLFTNLKGFFNRTTRPSDILGEQTAYMTTEQLKGAAVAASLDQAHVKLRQTFTSEVGAVNALTDAYRNAIQAQSAFSGVPGVPVGDANAMTPKKYANGVSMVPGPKGAGDIVPALLSPGEAVIPAKHAQKYAPVIAGMVAGNLPGFENGTTGVGMRQSIYGPMTLKQTEGLARTGVQLKDISDEVMAGPYANVPPTDFGTQIQPTTGHSFPAFEVGGIYQKPDGTKVFVKPQIDLTGAMAEVRGTEIARSAHGLVAPKQEIRVMMDPTDPEQKRRFLVLESALDERIANIPTKFTNDEYFTQLVASLLRGDKDLGVGNLGGNVLADVGPAGVFGRASGKRALGSAVNSMEEQAIINLLGVKGGAKRFFAEATSEQISKLTPAEYDAAMKAEMQKVAPKLQATIAGFGNMSPEEKAAYQAIQERLQAGMGVDWGKYQVMHSGVKPKEYEFGTAEVGKDGSKGKNTPTLKAPLNPTAFAQALQSMSIDQIKKNLRVQDTHLVTALNMKDPKFLAQVQRVYPGATPEELELFEPVSNLTAQLPGNANQVMKGKSGYPGSFFKTVWDGLENKLSKTAQIAGISMADSQSIENEIGNVIGSYPELINDGTMGDIIGDVLGSTAKVTDDAMMKRRMWELSEQVGSLRSKPKKAKAGGTGLFEGEEDGGETTKIIRKMLQDDALYWDKTTLRRKLSSGAEGPRFGGVNIDQFGHSSGRIEDIAARRLAQETLQEIISNPNMPMPKLPRAFALPQDWDKLSAGMSQEQQISQLVSLAKQGKLQVLNSPEARKPGKPAPLSFTKRDADDKTFNLGKSPTQQAYNSSRLKGSPLNWSGSQSQVLNAYDAMSKPFGTFQPIIPKTGFSFFNDLALKMEKGGIVPEAGKVGKPKASVFDIDDTLLDLSSFMEVHKAENEKLPEGQKKKWYKEVAKDPKGIPAGLAALKAAQERGNKILLMTARPDFYEPYTMETLQKLGIDMKGIKLIARKDKDYRKPEQMKYDKTAAFMKYYDIEEFYDDMPKTRGAVSLLGVPTYDPLKLAGGTFSVPGPKGAGDVVPAMLSPGEAVIPAKQAAKHRPMIQQMIAGQLPGYAMGGIIPGYNEGIGNVPFGQPVPVILIEDRTMKPTDKGPEGKEGDPVIIEESPDGQKKKEESNKRTFKDALKGQFQRTQQTGKVQSAMYVASSVAAAGSALPGEVGKAFQSIIGPIGAATSAMSLIPGNAGIVVGAFAALAVAGMQLKAHYDEVRDEAMKMTRALGSSNSALQKYAEFAKTVSGTEAMDKKRTASAGNYFNVVQGKTTFGESYMKSDAGKELVQSVDKQIKSGGGMKSAQELITQQLNTAIASGVMNPEQARSIANNLGAQLGDANFGISVSGKITDLYGPNGENLKNAPLEVALAVTKGSMDQFRQNAGAALSATTADKQGGAIASSVGAGVGVGLVGAGAGALASAGVGAIGAGLASITGAAAAATAAVGTTTAAVAGTAAAAGSAFPVVGTLIGAAVGVIAGATIGLIQYQEQIAKTGGAMAESMGSALTTMQQMVDSLQINYEKRIASARAAGDEALAIKLQNQYLEEQKTLMDSNAKNVAEMYKLVSQQDTGLFGGWFNTGMQNTLSDAANKAIEEAFKDSGMGMTAKLVQEAIDRAGGTKAQQIMLKQMVATKQVGLGQAQTATELFGGSEKGMNQLQGLMEKSPVEANRALGLAANMGSKKQKIEFITMVSSQDPDTEKRILDAMEMMQKTTGAFSGQPMTVKAILDFSAKNPEKMLAFKRNIDVLKQAKTIDVKIVQKQMGKDVAAVVAANIENFKKYNKQNKIVFLTELQTIMSMKGNPAMQKAYAAWVAEKGGKNKGKTFDDFANYQADRTVNTQGTDNTTGNTGNTEQKTPTGPTASFLDPYVESIRNASNWQQKLTIGFADSLKAMRRYGKEALNSGAGLAQRLKAYGADANFIQAVLGGDQKDIDKIIDRATGKLTKAGKDAIRIAKQVEDAKIGMAYVTSSESEQLGKDNELYSAGLDVLSNKEKKVNDKYDARVKALDEIGKIQEKNNQREQGTLDLADALSKGDIAAAARVALKVKQESQKAALDDAKANLENARKAELESLTVSILGHTETRQSLEAKIEKNTANIAANKLVELDRQVAIGKNAIIAADAADRALRAGTKIASLPKAYNPTYGDGSGGSSSGSGTGANAASSSTTGDIIGPENEKVKAVPKSKAPKAEKSMWDNIMGSIQAIIGGTYEALFAPIVNAVVSWFQKNVIDPIVNAWNAFASWFQTYIIKPITDAWNTLVGWIDTNVVQPIIAAWNRLSTWFNDNIITPIKNFFSWFVSDKSPEEKAEDVKKFWQGVGQWFAELPGKIGKFFADAWTKVSEWFASLPSRIAAIAGDIWKGITGIGAWLGEQAANFGKWFTTDLPFMIGQTAGNIWNFIQGIGPWLGEQWNNMVLWFQCLPASIGAAIGNVGNFFGTIFGNIGGWLGEQFTNIVTWFQELPGKVVATAKGVGNFFAKIFGDIGKWLGGVFSDIATWFKELPGKIMKFGKFLWEKGLPDMGTWLADRVKELGKWVTDLPGKVWQSIMDAGKAVGDWFGQLFSGFNSTQDKTKKKAEGGIISRYANGGSVMPKYFEFGGFTAQGTDTIPAMLTPGEFVIKKSAVDQYGASTLSQINNKTANLGGESVYNYSITVNSNSSDNSGIAEAVLREIKRVDSQRIRSSNS